MSNNNTKPLNSILIKPAGPDCNMACSYCFYLEKAELFPTTAIHRMTDDILEELVRQVMEQAGPEVSFGWQGGEPTLMGLAFFEKAAAFQQAYGRDQSVGNGLQTNGILIDKKWAKFLGEYRFLVGLSLDGPEHVHDFYRLTTAGKGTWETVSDRAKLLMDNGVEVNAVSVVNDYSARFPAEIYQYFKSMGFTFMQFIPCVETYPRDPGKAASFSVSPAKYGEFLIKLFDLWTADFEAGRPTTSIRYFDSVFYTYVNLPPPDCTLLVECGNYLVVEHNGDVYSCDFFVEPRWKLGNVKDGRLLDMLNSERQGVFGRRKKQLPSRCRKCKWLSFCRGGCVKDRMRDRRTKGVSYFHNSHRVFFEHAHERLTLLAKEFMRPGDAH